MPTPAPLLRLLLPAALGVLFGCASVPGKPLPEMVTDRPDLTDSPSIVPRAHPQLEAGYTYSRHEDDGTQTAHSYPEALLRAGILPDRLEVRIGQSFLTTTTPLGNGAAQTRTSGATDLYVSAKIRVADQRGARPEMALIPQATLPTGSAAFSAERTRPGLNLVYTWELVPNFLSVSGSTQGNRGVNGRDDYLQLTQSVSVGYQLSDRVEAFTEWFGVFPVGSRAPLGDADGIDGGFTVKLGPRLQWDIRAAVGLTTEADRFFAGSGLAVRY